MNKLKQTPLPIPPHTRMQVLRNICDTRACSREIGQYKQFVWQSSAAESCKKMGRRRRKSNVSWSPRRRHFTGSNQRALKKNSSRSIDVSGQSESASRRTCKWTSQHPSRQGCFKQRCSHRMAQQDKSSSLYMARALLERKYCELWRL